MDDHRLHVSPLWEHWMHIYMLPPRNTLRIGCFKGLKALGVDYCRSGVPARCVDVANVHLCWPMLVWACHDWISMDLGPHED